MHSRRTTRYLRPYSDSNREGGSNSHLWREVDRKTESVQSCPEGRALDRSRHTTEGLEGWCGSGRDRSMRRIRRRHHARQVNPSGRPPRSPRRRSGSGQPHPQRAGQRRREAGSRTSVPAFAIASGRLVLVGRIPVFQGTVGSVPGYGPTARRDRRRFTGPESFPAQNTAAPAPYQRRPYTCATAPAPP
jgi:hypothetical protein